MFPAQGSHPAPETSTIPQPGLVPSTDSDDPNDLHRMTYRILSTSNLRIQSPSDSAFAPLTITHTPHFSDAKLYDNVFVLYTQSLLLRTTACAYRIPLFISLAHAFLASFSMGAARTANADLALCVASRLVLSSLPCDSQFVLLDRTGPGATHSRRTFVVPSYLVLVHCRLSHILLPSSEC